MAEPLEAHETTEGINMSSIESVDSKSQNHILLEGISQTSRIRIALLEHERSVQTQRIEALTRRVKTLERSLDRHAEKRQQIIDQYERIIAEVHSTTVCEDINR